MYRGLIVDVGGALNVPEVKIENYDIRLARAYPQCDVLVLDPLPLAIKGPPNLYHINRVYDPFSPAGLDFEYEHLPFETRSVNALHFNFLIGEQVSCIDKIPMKATPQLVWDYGLSARSIMGVIAEMQAHNFEVNYQSEMVRFDCARDVLKLSMLLRETERILKFGGMLHIGDLNQNIKFAQAVIRNVLPGFFKNVTTRPMQEHEFTAHAAKFRKISRAKGNMVNWVLEAEI